MTDSRFVDTDCLCAEFENPHEMAQHARTRRMQGGIHSRMYINLGITGSSGCNSGRIPDTVVGWLEESILEVDWHYGMLGSAISSGRGDNESLGQLGEKYGWQSFPMCSFWEKMGHKVI
mmetsp:Transcript_9199/g.21945  ORF Transcript_9199/g.21945 Transcript_9199/m.21945 type:complete len:119 (-) Transcript_9199:565-921(-)